MAWWTPGNRNLPSTIEAVSCNSHNRQQTDEPTTDDENPDQSQFELLITNYPDEACDIKEPRASARAATAELHRYGYSKSRRRARSVMVTTAGCLTRRYIEMA